MYNVIVSTNYTSTRHRDTIKIGSMYTFFYILYNLLTLTSNLFLYAVPKEKTSDFHIFYKPQLNKFDQKNVINFINYILKH